MGLGGLVLGCSILYLESRRLVMFQLSGFYCNYSLTPCRRPSEAKLKSIRFTARVQCLTSTPNSKPSCSFIVQNKSPKRLAKPYSPVKDPSIPCRLKKSNSQDSNILKRSPLQGSLKRILQKNVLKALNHPTASTLN